MVQGSLGGETKLGVLGSQGDEMEQDGEEMEQVAEPQSVQSGGACAHEQRPTRRIKGSVSSSPRAPPSALPVARLDGLRVHKALVVECSSPHLTK